MNRNERRDMPIVIGIAVFITLAVIVGLIWGWHPS
jgi:hypothetical protein